MQITYREFVKRAGGILYDVHEQAPSLSCAISVVESEVPERVYDMVKVSPEQFASMYMKKEEELSKVKRHFYDMVFGREQ